MLHVYICISICINPKYANRLKGRTTRQPNDQLLWHVLATWRHAQNMAGICSRQKDAGNGRCWPQWDGGAGVQGTRCCHRGEPLVATEDSLLPCTKAPPGTCTCCQHRSHCSHPLPVLALLVPAAGTSPDCSALSAGTRGRCQPQLPPRDSPPPPAPEGQLEMQPPLATRTC